MPHKLINTFSIAPGVVKIGFKGVSCFMGCFISTNQIHYFIPFFIEL